MPVNTKTALLNSAERAARSRGFDGFSYADLAADVGIRKASIHHHFPAKADLAVALMERYHDRLGAACDDIDGKEPRASARLSAMIDVYRRAHDGGKSLCLCAAFSTSRESLPEPVIQCISRFRSMMVAWFASVFELGRADGSIADVHDPAHEAAAILPLLEGAQLAARAEENPELFEKPLHLMLQRMR
ncbi:MAG: TetR/AcrR family transcriptional regulator [Alphaproteobacteria bacterium]|nr:TetR/AcrR family transcriptional regulator [Alphaproteobacteria bacterium]